MSSVATLPSASAQHTGSVMIAWFFMSSQRNWKVEVNPGERQSNVDVDVDVIQSQMSLAFLNTVLIFSSNLIKYSHKVRGSGSTEGKKLSKTKKAAVRRANCYLSVSSCPALPLLLIPLCAPLVMRQSCGSLWNLIRISRKQARWAICLQPAFTITSLLQPSILFSFTQLYSSLISAIPHPSLLLSSGNFTSRIHFNSFPPVFHTCWSKYGLGFLPVCIMQLEGRTLWLKPSGL